MKSRVKALRAKTGLSQIKFAKVLGVAVATLRRWESGDTSPSPMALNRIEELEALTDDDLTKECSKLAVDEVVSISEEMYKTEFRWNGVEHKAVWMPYVINGPEDQLSFYKKLICMQENSKANISDRCYFERLSLLKSVDGIDTAQFRMEAPKPTAKSWSSDYGTHGFHRYVGRFPAHLIRALINAFGADENDTILDPFCGSGTTLVEARMLGIKAKGIEISPLSAMISRVKSQFPDEGLQVTELVSDLTIFYMNRWDEFVQNQDLDSFSYEEILKREGNTISHFANIERWFTKEALLGTSIIVEFISNQTGYVKDFLTIALSSKMRSIGNVDVDVVRAEYRKTPRQNVDVLKLVKSQILKMSREITNTIVSSKNIIGTQNDIEVIQGSVLNINLGRNSISHIITSPPYGVESLSYLRTHLLSFRALESILGVDPYNFGEEVIGSEYLDKTSPDIQRFKVQNVSKTYTAFFGGLLKKKVSGAEEKRILMMMKFFEDMYEVVAKFDEWLKPGGHVAFVIGNKKIGDDIIPTDTIITEIFERFGFGLDESIPHKLKTNNSNSQVPWQDRIIENEFVMLFTKESRKNEN
ncbi:MAG: helix-turn-helix domain-containing protein [Dorea sp.]|nr:helix-turn-helix domain-containing protein [Dorea sp.]